MVLARAKYTQMQSPVSIKVPDVHPDGKTLNRAGIPYCPACKSLVAGHTIEKQAYVHSGWLQRKKSKFHVKTKRWFIVADGHVFYYSDSNEVGRSLPKGVLHLTQGSVADGNVDDSSQTFYLSGIGHEALKLEAMSESEKRQWLGVLTDQIASNPSGASHRKSDLSPYNRICSECNECVSLDSFTLGSHVGWLTKQGGDIKTWKRRWVVLSKSHMCYYRTPDDVAVFKPVKLLHCVKASRLEPSSKPYTFTVDSGGRVFYFVCDNENDYHEWLRALHIEKHCPN